MSSKNITKQRHNISHNTGIYDPNGLYNNPFTNQPYQNLYANELTKDKQPKTYL